MSGGGACLCAWVSGVVGCMSEGLGRLVVWCDSVGYIAGVVCVSLGPDVTSCILYSTINILLCYLPNIHLN